MKGISEFGLCFSLHPPTIHSHTPLLLHPFTHSLLIITVVSTAVLWPKLENNSFKAFFFFLVAAKVVSSVCVNLGRLVNLHCRLDLSSRVYCLELPGEFLFWKSTGIAQCPWSIWNLVLKEKPVQTCHYWLLVGVGGIGSIGKGCFVCSFVCF